MKKLTPVKSIRKQCLLCCNGSSMEVENCGAVNCPIYPYRFGKRKISPKPKLTPIKAIKAKCADCGEGTFKDRLSCHFEDCTLYPYRLGHRPKKV